MIEAIKSFFQNNIESVSEEPAASEQGVEVAACALLLELAYSDDEFSEPERVHLKSVIQRHFDIPEEKTDELIQLADRERRQSVDLFQFTRLITQTYNDAQKMVLAEAMWGLVFADGEVAKHETYLMRKISHLLGIKAGFLSEARKRAEPGR